tara:strand:+ start:508 stop:1587 length:1080 start_codon:yes stop_codon:yes gene_type:complete
MANATQEDAIQTGLDVIEPIEEVNDDSISTEEEESLELSEREKALNKIFESRERELEEDMGVSFDDESSSEEVEEVEEVEVQAVEEKAPIWKDGDQWMTVVKVDGSEVNVPFETLKASHQKDKASQKRFEEAAVYARRVKEREDKLNSYISQMRRQPQQEVSSPSQDATKEVSEDRADLAKQYHQALYDDKAEEAADLLVKLTNSGRTNGATPNVDQAVQSALNRHMAEQQVKAQRRQEWAYHKSREDSVNWFNDQYPDIANVPEFRAIADNKTIELQQEHSDWSPQQIIHEAAEFTRQWVQEMMPSKKEDVRVRRKKNIVSQPKSASASAHIGEDEPEPQSASQIIEEMKKVRGQNLL